MISGVDVSSHQAAWRPAPSDSFVFVKATEGHTYVSAALPDQVAAARAAGLVVGLYHFLWPGDPLLQADWFARAIRTHGTPKKDLLVCDWEATKSGTATEADKDAFIAEVKRLLPGYKVGLYVNRSMWGASMKRPGDFLWLAAYTADPGVTGWTFWQYADHGPQGEPFDQNHANFSTAAELRDWINPPEVNVSDERIPFRRAGLTCRCVVDSLPLVEDEMLLRGLISNNIDIFQLGYRSDVAASSGTHARGFNIDVGQYSPAHIDIWRLHGWNIQHRTTAQGFTLEHGHGGPWGCPHGSPAAQDQIAQWRNRQNGLVSHGPVEGRWPIKNYRAAMDERKKIVMSLADDIVKKVVAAVGTTDEIAKATRDHLLNDRAIPSWHDKGDPWPLQALLRDIRQQLEVDATSQQADELKALLGQVLAQLQKPPTPPTS